MARLSHARWAELHGVTREHVRLVLRGERKPSAELDAAITATIEKYLGRDQRKKAKR